MATDIHVATGELPAELANAISHSIHFALSKGMDLDVAVCIVAGVAADYGRGSYGDAYLEAICDVIRHRAGRPMPRSVKDRTDG